MEKPDVTLTEEVPALVRVAFMVGLVAPTATPPKFTGKRRRSPGAKGVPWMGADCGLPEALSVTLRVALLTALPGGFAAV